MSTMRHRVLSTLLILSGVCGVAAPARAQSPLELLEERGLTRQGKFFVIKDEEPVFQKFFNMQPDMKRLDVAYRAWEDIVVNESTYLNLVDYRIQLTAHLNDVNGQISRMPSRTAQDKMNLQQAILSEQR